MKSSALLTLCCSVLLSAPLVAMEGTTQRALSKYRDTLEEVYANNSKPADIKIRDQLLLQAKNQFTKDSAAAPVPEKTISQHFDTFMDNVAAANNAFRFKDGAKVREQWINEAARIFLREAKEAKDFKSKRALNTWFETFADMLQNIRDKLALYAGLGPKVAQTIASLFTDVYKAAEITRGNDATSDFKDHLALIKKLFPVTKPDLQTKNGPFVTILEGHATTVFKDRTK